MESSQQQLESETTEFSKTVAVSEPNTQSQLSVTGTDEKWQRLGAQTSTFLADLPDNLGRFVNQTKQPLISIGLILAAFITLRVVLAVIDVLNDIPLLAPALKLIGIGYSFWFTNRYLLRASTRQELSQLIQGFLKR